MQKVLVLAAIAFGLTVMVEGPVVVRFEGDSQAQAEQEPPHGSKHG